MSKRREENQLDATECFIAIIICSTCFGHSYNTRKSWRFDTSVHIVDVH